MTSSGRARADVVQRTATQSAARRKKPTQDAATGGNGIEAQDDGASIQIILEPRMIEKNGVRLFGLLVEISAYLCN